MYELYQIGSSVAYHLGLKGWGPHTTIVEQNQIGESSKWYSSGLVGTFKSSHTQVKMCRKSVNLIEELGRKGYNTGWKQCGALNLARNRDRMTSYRRLNSLGAGWNIKSKLVSPDECAELCPIIQTDDLIGGLWIPGDGVADPNAVCHALISECIKMGVSVVEHCGITQINQTDGKVSSVETTGGTVDCIYFVNCAGFWARTVGQLSEPNVKVPLHPVEHYYLHTKPVDGLSPNTPVIRDMDGNVYMREHDGRILAGGYEVNAKPAYEDGVYPAMDRQLPPDWDHFHMSLEQILKRMPLLRDCGLEKLCNGPEIFPPDGKWILGESPEIKNYLVAVGMKTVGISAGGGVGKAIADIITQGYSKLDIYELDISRFLGLHNNRKFLRDRSREVPGLHYAVTYPFHEFKTGRSLRMSPIFPALQEAGAVFSQLMGYERPAWFDKEGAERVENGGHNKFRLATTETFGKPVWFDFAATEYDACREKIGLCDYSSYTKIDLWSPGREVVELLQYLCSNDVDVPIGSIIHTGMQNQSGGYENDCSLARLAENQ